MRYFDDDGHLDRIPPAIDEFNGNTFDLEGRQITANAGRLVRYEHNGTITTLAEKANGKPLNSPNDMVVTPDESIWFTDPGYGTGSFYEGIKAELEQEKHNGLPGRRAIRGSQNVADDRATQRHCLSATTTRSSMSATPVFTHYPTTPRISRAFDLDGRRKALQQHADRHDVRKSGFPDGLRVDTDGNIWVASVGAADDDGVRFFAPDGARSARSACRKPAPMSASAARSATGFHAASQSLYAVYRVTQGAHEAVERVHSDVMRERALRGAADPELGTRGPTLGRSLARARMTHGYPLFLNPADIPLMVSWMPRSTCSSATSPSASSLRCSFSNSTCTWLSGSR